MRKLFLVTIMAAVVIGATPIEAQPVGNWEGTGEGYCPYPIPYPSEYMNPWQTWMGRLVPNPNQVGYIFYGEWQDREGNRGTFEGEAALGTPEEIYCRGEWYWIDESVIPHRTYLMGSFNMVFRRDGRSCRGEWEAYDPNAYYHGTMEGRWVGL